MRFPDDVWRIILGYKHDMEDLDRWQLFMDMVLHNMVMSLENFHL